LTYWLKIVYYTLSRSATPLAMFLLEFAVKFTLRKLGVMGLPSSEDRIIVAWVILTQCQRVTDSQTDQRTADGFAIASTALCMACYADAL